jgi:hypothetical protein
MAEKFPTLDGSKQRAFGLDMARFGLGGSRAAVVVAERGRLSLHWSRDDGTWGRRDARTRGGEPGRRGSSAAGHLPLDGGGARAETLPARRRRG